MHYLIALPIWLGFIGWLVMSSATGSTAASSRRYLRALGRLAFLGAGAALVAVVAVGTGFLGTSGSEEAAATGRTAWVIPPRAAAPRSVPMPLLPPLPVAAVPPAGMAPLAGRPAAVATTAADAARVKVTAETGLRSTPSRNAAVLRVAHRGDVLTRFAAANGWIQVGSARPEGWVPERLAAPAS